MNSNALDLYFTREMPARAARERRAPRRMGLLVLTGAVQIGRAIATGNVTVQQGAGVPQRSVASTLRRTEIRNVGRYANDF